MWKDIKTETCNNDRNQTVNYSHPMKFSELIKKAKMCTTKGPKDFRELFPWPLRRNLGK